MSAYYSRNSSYSRSLNAEVAESEGRLPLSRAVKVVAEKFACSQEVARAAIKFLGTAEWHHVGKFANRVDYYDCENKRLGGVIREVKKHGAKRFSARTQAARRYEGVVFTFGSGRIAAMAARRAAIRDVARACGFSVESYPVGLWNTLCEKTDDSVRSVIQFVRAGRALGWSDDHLALALLEGGANIEEVSESLA